MVVVAVAAIMVDLAELTLSQMTWVVAEEDLLMPHQQYLAHHYNKHLISLLPKEHIIMVLMEMEQQEDLPNLGSRAK
jgi:hypothetical protein